MYTIFKRIIQSNHLENFYIFLSKEIFSKRKSETLSKNWIYSLKLCNRGSIMFQLFLKMNILYLSEKYFIIWTIEITQRSLLLAEIIHFGLKQAVFKLSDIIWLSLLMISISFKRRNQFQLLIFMMKIKITYSSFIIHVSFYFYFCQSVYQFRKRCSMFL
jgi:hypothetical protein